MFLQECHGLPSHIFLLQLRLPREALHLLLEQEKVITLLCAIAELIKEFVDIVSAPIIHIYVESDECGLDERHDLF